jgi:hypothetical protein
LITQYASDFSPDELHHVIVAAAWADACRRAGISKAALHLLRYTWARLHYAVQLDWGGLKAEGD